MRRRRPEGAPMTAAAVVEIYARAQVEASHLPKDRRWRQVRDELLAAGTSPVEALRARLWLRRGRTDNGWRW